MVNLYSELKADFKETEPIDFYREIFPFGELDKKDAFTDGKFTGIAVEFTNQKKVNSDDTIRKRFTITDDLDTIKELLKSENFIIISPISYVGKKRLTVNARVMYAFVIEIDHIRVDEDDNKAVGYYDLIHQMKKGILPMVNYIVASGNGLHLYYLFEKPLVLYPNVKQSLVNFKRDITPKFWNRYITTSYTADKIQNESVFQGFRLAGGSSKDGERTKIFEISKDKVSVDYLNSFLSNKKNSIEKVYKSKYSLDEAKKQFPNWHNERIVQGKQRSSWTCKRDLYDWWLRRIKDEVNVGHRYYCLMILAIYAIKSGITYDELEKDCFSLLDPFDAMSDSDKNRFTKKDIVSALQSFQDKDLVTYPINSIIKLSGIPIEKNKRNFRKQSEHLKLARFVRDELNGKKDIWRNKEGRPKGSKNKVNVKQKIVNEYVKNYPSASPTEIARALGISRTTVYKYIR